MKVVRLSALHTGHLYLPRKYFSYSFLWQAESTPRLQRGLHYYVNIKFQWLHRELNLRPGFKYSASPNCITMCPICPTISQHIFCILLPQNPINQDLWNAHGLSVHPSIHPSTYLQTVHCSTNSNLVNCVFIQKATYFLVIWTCSLHLPRCGSVNTVTRLQVNVAKKKDLIPGRVRALHFSTIPDWLWG